MPPSTSTTRNARSSSTKRQTSISPSTADEVEQETSSGATNPIAKVAKLTHLQQEEVDDYDGAVTATDYGHDVYAGAAKEDEDAPMESDAAVAPPLLGPIRARLPPLSPVANPTMGNESIPAAAAAGNDKDGDGEVAEDEKAADAVAGEFSQDLEEGMPLLADNEVIVANTNKKSRKERREFTAAEKLRIISEIQTAPSLQSVLDKYGVSKSSLHRWRQPDKLEQLHDMVTVGGPDIMVDGVMGDDTSHPITNLCSSRTSTENKDMYRKRVMNDKLRQIKLGLWEFCKNNMNRDEDERLAITSTLIKLKAMQIKEDLLRRHHANESTDDLLTDEEVAALNSFQASKSWTCQMGNHLGYLSSGTSIQWTDQAKANTAAYIEEHSCNPSKPKKQRMEFTAEEKLAIVKELEETNVQNKAQRKPAITVEEICRKYDTSKSSIHRWQQQYRSGRLQELAATTSGYSNSKRIFTCRLHVVKQDLHNFYMANERASLDNKVSMTFATLQSRALATKVSLLERHYAAIAVRDQEVIAKQQEDGEGVECKEELQPEEQELANVEGAVAEGGCRTSSSIDIMSEEEANALVNFKASNSWLREVAKKFGWKLDVEKRDTTSRSTVVDHSNNTMTMAQYNVVAQDDQEIALSDAQENSLLEEQEPLDYVVEEEHMLVLNEEEICTSVIV